MKRPVDQSRRVGKQAAPVPLAKLSRADLIAIVEAQRRELEACRVAIRMLREPTPAEPVRVIWTA